MEEPETNVAQVSPSVPLDQREQEQFFAAASHRVELAGMLQRRRDKWQATGFNVLDLIEPDENKLSDILAGLLDPKGGHGQGELFLRLLFKQLNLGTNGMSPKEVTVQREAPTHGIMKYRRRIDILIEAGSLLAIENKVDSLEQRDQIKDYLEHLSYCGRGRTIKTALIYLTPDGRSPGSLQPSEKQELRAKGRLHCWSYQGELRKWLDSCRRQSEAPKIKYFLSDFIAYVESALKRESQNNQEEETDES
ncbi:MAG: PD-(D/E)XK nuclease family protein [Ignavibacteriales bacterium]|nr:PD-(D/E)XK nuclease family protein [Ignavibacteriales bacterium]